MKKISLLAVTTAIMVMLAGCGGEANNKENASNANANTNANATLEPVTASNNGADDGADDGAEETDPADEQEAEVAPEPEAEPEPEPEPEPEAELTYAPGDKFVVGDWEITLDSFEFNQKVSDDYFSSSADEGNKFLVLHFSLTNNGKEAENFANMFGGISLKAIYKGDYEYGATMTMINGDLHGDSVKPLATKKGFIVFETPDQVADSTESLQVLIKDGKDQAKLTLR